MQTFYNYNAAPPQVNFSALRQPDGMSARSVKSDNRTSVIGQPFECNQQWCKSYFLKVTRYSYKLPAEKSNALQLLVTDTQK